MVASLLRYDRLNANRVSTLALHRRRCGKNIVAASGKRAPRRDAEARPLLDDDDDVPTQRPFAYDMTREWESYACMLLTRTKISDPTQTELSV